MAKKKNKDIDDKENEKNYSELIRSIESMRSINSLALDYTYLIRNADSLREIGKINIPAFENFQFAIPNTPYNFKYEVENSEKIENIKNDLNELNKRNRELISAIENKDLLADEKNKKIEELERNNKKILEDIKLIHITSRIHNLASKKLLEDTNFRENFSSNNEFEGSVISIDIRRSTDLMLESRSSAEYSEFIFELTRLLKECIIRNFGIFDKFTGDGILAFFPKFYSGEQSILFALRAAKEAHVIFDSIYKEHRKSFNIVLTDVGLGVGIDFGKVNIYQTNSELSIVGKPVVYACRYSSTHAFSTLNNHGVIIELEKLIPKEFYVSSERIIQVKNKGNCLGFDIEIDWKKINFTDPEWLN